MLSLWWEKYLISFLFHANLVSRDFHALIMQDLHLNNRHLFLKIACLVYFSFFSCMCHQHIICRILVELIYIWLNFTCRWYILTILNDLTWQCRCYYKKKGWLGGYFAQNGQKLYENYKINTLGEKQWWWLCLWTSKFFG